MRYCSEDRNEISRQMAERYHDAGLNVLPVKCNGSKAPDAWHWSPDEHFPFCLVRQKMGSRSKPVGIAVICGPTSGDLEVLDFDLWASVVFPSWRNTVSAQLPGLLDTLPIVQTPKGGRHVYYRCEAVGRRLILAQVERGDKLRIIIETRGHGNYVIAPGSPLTVHDTGRPYRLIQGDLSKIPSISCEQRDVLLWNARYFNRYWPKPQSRVHKPQNASVRTDDVVSCRGRNRPGDWFNATATWEEVLEPHDWTIAGQQGSVIYWRKPDSTGNERHATTGYGGRDKLHVFSTSAFPFEEGHEYDKFQAHTFLNHGGDFGKAARAVKTERAARIHLAMEDYVTSN
jgi:Bifunctional DNA primase/polymerase, N-terminal